MDWKALRKFTKKPIAKSCEIIERDERFIPQAVSIKYFPMAIERGEGALVWDADDNRYIDFLTSAAVYNAGHCHPAIVEAVRKQVGKLQNYTVVYFYNDRQVRLAELLTGITPGTFPKKAAFAFSGSDGVDAAIRAARSFTGRKQILSFKDSYHGMTTVALSVTGIIGQEIKDRVCPDRNVIFAEYPDSYRNSWGIDGYADPAALSRAAMEAVEALLAKHRGDIAAVLIEPAQGDGGMIFPPKEFMRQLREATEREGIVFIDEEVQTGMGRSGKWWTIEHFDVVPDLIVSAKALGGGMPISAVVGRADILDSVPVPLLAYTHTGHAVTCAAAEATIGVVKNERLAEKAEEKGRRLTEWFRERAKQYPFIGDIRQKGLLMGVEIVSDRKKKTPDKAMALKISWAAWERGLILITFGKDGNVLRVAPPLNIPEDLFQEALGIMNAALEDAASGRVSDDILPYLKGW
ncbi:MAG: aspartate aminotransferase family protein [Thermovirgaceae bacterium]|nr:aspartate aminotransferase family protein [Thermovirgaceae bacterium]